MVRVIAGLVTALALSGAAQAMPSNLLTDGSFENGFTGWTIGGNGAAGPVITPTDGNTAGPFGDRVPSDPITSGSSDPGGVQAAFFYDDSATDSLSQNVLITAGTVYQVGFDLFKTGSGAGNPAGFTFSESLGSQTVAVSSTSLATATWTHYSAQFTALTTAVAVFNLVFTAASGTGQDVIVDRAYVVAVPEPASIALLGLGLAGLGVARRRARSTRQAARRQDPV